MVRVLENHGEILRYRQSDSLIGEYQNGHVKTGSMLFFPSLRQSVVQYDWHREKKKLKETLKMIQQTHKAGRKI